MFSVDEYAAGRVQVRREALTGIASRISPERLRRNLSLPYVGPSPGDCPFCPGRVERETPTFPDGTRILRGESVTFPNLYPFADWHLVTVITRAHAVERFTVDQVADALTGLLDGVKGGGGYVSLNWNYLPSAGASIPHPHLQGIADPSPTSLQGRYLAGSRAYYREHGRSYWADLVEEEAATDRFLFEDVIPWFASAVPVGEREVRGILPVASPADIGPCIRPLARGILRVIACYRTLGTRAFNMALYCGTADDTDSFSAVCSIIARLNPNPTSMTDSAFMERLHFEPVVMTLPEEFGRYFQENGC
jgi:UDPglucose--hexose-1-phosphate uridylyltransferase